MLNQNKITRLIIFTALILLIPVFGNFFVDGWNWSFFDFIFAGVLIFSTGFAYQLVASRGNSTTYRMATGLALATAFALVWINAAVGLIGDGDLDSPNALYFGVLLIGLISAISSRSRPQGMSRALFATAIAQLLVPPIALIFWPPATTSWAPGVLPVFCLNAVFAVLFAVSGWLFGRAGKNQR